MTRTVNKQAAENHAAERTGPMHECSGASRDRNDKIAQLKELIRRKSYRVNAEAVAEAIMTSGI